jgi:hypothetical protein
MKIIATILFIFSLSLSSIAKDNNTPVPFTLGDRDRLMRNEQKIDALRSEMNIRFDAMQNSVDSRFNAMQKQMDTRFESMESRINFLTTLMMFVLGGLMSLIGFVIYDRRTAIKPVQREQAEISEELIKLKKENSIFREAMKKAGML